MTVVRAIRKVLNDKQGIYSRKTLLQYKAVMNLCEDVDSDQIEDFNHFAVSLLSDMGQKGISNSSAKTYIKKVISALNYSGVPHNLKINKVFQGTKQDSRSQKTFLSMSDIKRIEKFRPSKDRLKIIRDLFVFCAYTGLRYSEAMSLISDNIQNGEFQTIRYTSYKTSITNEVPLNDTCLKIIKRYRGGEKLLPQLSDSKCNKYLHELLQEMKFNDTIVKVHYVGNDRREQVIPKWKLVTFHTSRHSYISNLISAGMDIQSVSDLVGVSVVTLVKHYSHSDKTERINKAFKILNQ
jgi:integrase